MEDPALHHSPDETRHERDNATTISRREFLRRGGQVAGAVLVGSIISYVPELGEAKEPDTSRSREAISCLNEHDHFHRQPVEFQAAQKIELDSVTSQVLEHFVYFGRHIQELANPHDIDQALIKLYSAVRELLPNDCAKISSSLSPMRRHLQLTESVIVPFLARQGLYVKNQSHLVFRRTGNGKSILESAIAYPNAVQEIQSVREQKYEGFLGHEGSFSHSEVILGPTPALLAQAKLKSFGSGAEMGLTAYDTTFFPSENIGAREASAFIKLFESLSSKEAQSVLSASQSKINTYLNRQPAATVNAIASQIGLYRLAEQIQQKAGHRDVATVFEPISIKRLRLHESGHVYFDRKDTFPYCIPNSQSSVSQEEYYRLQRQLLATKEIGAMLAELRLADHHDMQFATLLNRAIGPSRGQHDDAAHWILDEVLQRVALDPDYFGIELDDNEARHKQQIITQLATLATQPKKVHELADDILRTYEENLGKPFITGSGDTVSYPIDRFERTITHRDAWRVSDLFGPVATAGAAAVVGTAFKRWYENKSKDRREKEQRQADMEKRKATKNGKKSKK